MEFNASNSSTSLSPITTTTNTITTESGGREMKEVKGLITWDDATWILTSAFIIFTMQSGFGMLEAGAVSNKNSVNIMVKNVVDVVFGGMTYWMFGYALSFGEGPYSNPFCGIGDFFVDTSGEDMGLVYAAFVFQLSFATTATTIVSGAMAERTNLTAYIVFSLSNTIVYCIPAHWVWGANGFLGQLGSVDFAGSGVVHLVGACSGLVGTLMLKPRTGRFDSDEQWPPLVNPVNAIIGTFMLWWGWLAFNCGSTFGISGGKWMLASKAAFNTLLSSMSGGIVGILVSYIVKKGKYDVAYLINSILGALVSCTASCPLVRSYEAVIIGVVGALSTLAWSEFMEFIKVDDPVSAVAVHGAGGTWGLLAVGLFAKDDEMENLTGGLNGVLKGGGFYLLGVQVLTIVCEVVWSMSVTFILLFVIDKAMGLRVTLEEERIGADFFEHGVEDPSMRLTRLLDKAGAATATSSTLNDLTATLNAASTTSLSMADSTTNLMDVSSSASKRKRRGGGGGKGGGGSGAGGVRLMRAVTQECGTRLYGHYMHNRSSITRRPSPRQRNHHQQQQGETRASFSLPPETKNDEDVTTQSNAAKTNGGVVAVTVESNGRQNCNSISGTVDHEQHLHRQEMDTTHDASGDVSTPEVTGGGVFPTSSVPSSETP